MGSGPWPVEYEVNVAVIAPSLRCVTNPFRAVYTGLVSYQPTDIEPLQLIQCCMESHESRVFLVQFLVTFSLPFSSVFPVKMEPWANSRILLWDVKFSVAVNIKITSDVTPCIVVDFCQRFERICCVHFSLGYKSTLRWQHQVPPKRWYPSARIHGVTSKKTMIMRDCSVIASHGEVRSSYLIVCLFRNSYNSVRHTVGLWNADVLCFLWSRSVSGNVI